MDTLDDPAQLRLELDHFQDHYNTVSGTALEADTGRLDPMRYPHYDVPLLDWFE